MCVKYRFETFLPLACSAMLFPAKPPAFKPPNHLNSRKRLSPISKLLSPEIQNFPRLSQAFAAWARGAAKATSSWIVYVGRKKLQDQFGLHV